MKKMKYVYIAVMLLFVICTNAVGAEVYNTTITNMITYTKFGGGDVIVKVATSHPNGCEGGFWLDKDAPGFQATLTFLLSAFHANSKISISVIPSEIWDGSGAKYCKIDWVQIAK